MSQVTVVFQPNATKNVNGGMYGYRIGQYPTVSGHSGFATPSTTPPSITGTGAYGGILFSSGMPNPSNFVGVAYFTGDVTLVFGPMVTVLEG